MSITAIAQVDLDTSMPTASVVHAKQYDSARKIACHLMQDSQPWVVPDSNGILGLVSYKKADRIGGFYDHTSEGELAVTVDGTDRSTVYVALDVQTLTTAGEVHMEIVFYDTANGEATKATRLSTFAFVLLVEAASLQEIDLASDPNFNVLAEQIQEVITAKNSIVGLTATASTGNAGTNASVTVSGGTTGVPYNLAFIIPRGNTGAKGDTGATANPTNTTYKYAITTSPTNPPADSSSDWKDSISISSSGETIPSEFEGKYVWSRAKTSWSNNTTTTLYSVSYLGRNGDGSGVTAGVATINGASGDVWLTASDVYAVSYSEQQSLSAVQKNQAIANIGAIASVNGQSGASITLDASHVECVSYASNSQNLNSTEQQNARTNMGVAGFRKYSNVQVTTNRWAAYTSSNVPGYGYRATIPNSVGSFNINTNEIVEVVFSGKDAASGNYAPVCDSYNGGFYIYAVNAPTGTITLPTVIVWT